MKTKSFNSVKDAGNAVEFEDYLPKEEKLEFEHGEIEKRVTISLMGNPDNKYKKNSALKKSETKYYDNVSNSSSDDYFSECKFKVILIDAEPKGVNISKKSVCVVTIVKGDVIKEEDGKENMFFFYMKMK